MPLVGKYFFFSTDEYYTYGKVLENLGEGFFLVHKTGCEKPYDCIYHLAQLTDGNEGRSCQFFETEVELQDYIEWVQEPSETDKKKVLKLVKNDED
jgi:hypothetical protein